MIRGGDRVIMLGDHVDRVIMLGNRVIMLDDHVGVIQQRLRRGT